MNSYVKKFFISYQNDTFDPIELSIELKDKQFRNAFENLLSEKAPLQNKKQYIDFKINEILSKSEEEKINENLGETEFDRFSENLEIFNKQPKEKKTILYLYEALENEVKFKAFLINYSNNSNVNIDFKKTKNKIINMMKNHFSSDYFQKRKQEFSKKLNQNKEILNE